MGDERTMGAGGSPHAALRLRSPDGARQLLPRARAPDGLHPRRLDADLRCRAPAHRGRRHRLRGDSQGARRGPASDPALPPGAEVDAPRGYARLGRRPDLQPRLPPAPHRAAAPGQRRPAQAPLRPRHAAAPRPPATALGDLGGRGPRGESLRPDLQGPPLHDRRGLRSRPPPDPAEPGPGGGAPDSARLRSAAGPQRRRAAARCAVAAALAAVRRAARLPQLRRRGA
jgi:hypothetical protein